MSDSTSHPFVSNSSILISTWVYTDLTVTHISIEPTHSVRHQEHERDWNWYRAALWRTTLGRTAGMAWRTQTSEASNWSMKHWAITKCCQLKHQTKRSCENKTCESQSRTSRDTSATKSKLSNFPQTTIIATYFMRHVSVTSAVIKPCFICNAIAL